MPLDFLKGLPIPDVSSLLHISGHLVGLNRGTDKKTPNEKTRYSGGFHRETQPYITGYHQILVYLPLLVFLIDTFKSEKWLRTTCESFTPHTSTMQMADVPGFGGVNLSFPTARQINREFTLGFREYQNLPILNIFKMWHSIYNPVIGVSPYSSYMKNPFYKPDLLKGIIVVANVKPSHNNGDITADDIEDANIYNGCFPVNIPNDTINASDQASNESVIATVTFRFDGAPFDLNSDPILIRNLIVNQLNASGSYEETYDDVGVFL